MCERKSGILATDRQVMEESAKKSKERSSAKLATNIAEVRDDLSGKLAASRA